jgi:hypothetical protein
MMRAAGESQRHRRTRGDDGNNKALPQMSDVGSDKRHNDGGQQVAREYVAEKKHRQQLTMANRKFQGWLTERRSGIERRWQETVEMVKW